MEQLEVEVRGCQEIEAKAWRDLQDLRENGAQEGCSRLAATKATLRVKEASTALAKSKYALALLQREVHDGHRWIEYLEEREAALWTHYSRQVKSREIWEPLGK